MNDSRVLPAGLSVTEITAADIFTSDLSKPMPPAAKAALQVVRGDAPDDELAGTEAALAAEFSVAFGDSLRFDFRRRLWMRCDHGAWHEDRTAGALRQLQSWAETRVFEQVARAVSKRDMVATAAAAKRALSARALRNVLDLAAAQIAMADDGKGWDPDPWLIVTRDGTAVDLRTGEARTATPADRVTLTLGVTYDAGATCPTFLRFLRDVCDDDPALVDLVHKAAGYSLSGDTREQKFFICFGNGANGKSTLLEALAFVMGDLAAVIPFSVLMRDRDTRSVPVEIAQLPGRRFVRASELRAGSPIDEGRIKAMTGGDVLKARGLYQMPFEFRPIAKMWLACNSLPRVDDRTFSFWRRAIAIPFTRTFEGASCDPQLSHKLQAEWSGILNWMVKGALAWQREGLPQAEAARAVTQDWRESQDMIGQWASTCLVTHVDGRLKAADAYRRFGAWAEAEALTERERPGRRTFGEWMAQHFTRKSTASGKVYLARLVDGEGSDALTGNPLTRAQGEDLPGTLNTLNYPHLKASIRV